MLGPLPCNSPTRIINLQVGAPTNHIMYYYVLLIVIGRGLANFFSLHYPLLGGLGYTKASQCWAKGLGSCFFFSFIILWFDRNMHSANVTITIIGGIDTAWTCLWTQWYYESVTLKVGDLMGILRGPPLECHPSPSKALWIIKGPLGLNIPKNHHTWSQKSPQKIRGWHLGGVCIPYMPLNSYDDPSNPLMAYIGCHGSKRQLVSSESLMQVGQGKEGMAIKPCL